MGKGTLKVFTLAAAAIATHLIALDAKAVQVKRLEELSREERLAMTRITNFCAYSKSGQASATSRKA